MDAFAERTEVIEEAARLDDLQHVHDRMQRILSDD